MIPFPEISPEIFTIHIFGTALSLRWYALAYLVGLLVGWWIIAALMRRPHLWGGTAPMAPGKAEELLTWVIGGVIVGGRLGFVLFYEPATYLANPGQIIRIDQGGMSFHGGFLGVVIASWIFCRRNGIPVLAPSLSWLHHHHSAPPHLRPKARPEGYQRMDLIAPDRLDRKEAMISMPALIKAYLRLGGVVGEGAFIDRDFNTTDVFLLMDTSAMSAKHRKFYEGRWQGQ